MKKNKTRIISEFKILRLFVFVLVIILMLANISLFLKGEKIFSGSLKETIDVKNLKILTINVWTGLNYQGSIKMGEYESKLIRKKRFLSLVTQIVELDPDIIFIQEANPVRNYSRKLSKLLGYTEIHQVCNGGIKFGSLGLPSNLKEGNSILAKPHLDLKKFKNWKLSGGFGLFGDLITFHFKESIFALVGKILVDKIPVYLTNIHLSACPPKKDLLYFRYKEWIKKEIISEDSLKNGENILNTRNLRRKKETQKLLELLSSIPKNSPIILAGDLNAEPGSPEFELLRNGNFSNRFIDTFNSSSGPENYTWDPERNLNLLNSIDQNMKDLSRDGVEGFVRDLYSHDKKRIDYILLNNSFNESDVKDCRIVLDKKVNGIQPSDHFGIYAEVNLEKIKGSSQKELDTIVPAKRSKFEFFPILMYDTDIGIGYGLKAFYFNPLKSNESFDLTIFNSSKGERWYRFLFSWPDIELRQGKKYPLAVDLLVDYDKKIKNSFFGAGNGSKFEDREVYSKEPFEFNLALSRSFTTHLVGQIGFRYKSIKNFNFDEEGYLIDLEPELNQSAAKYTSLFGNVRYDTRDSFINPSRGVVLKGEVEFSLSSKISNVSFSRASMWLQNYFVLFFPRTVLATRLSVQNLWGKDLPIQVLLPMGGNRTLRGFPQDRFLGRTSVLFNVEVRFPIWSRLGGIFGIDTGKVWDSLKEIDLKKWELNPVVGIRYNMKNFVVRLDVGFGRKYTGLYFNFGHIF